MIVSNLSDIATTVRRIVKDSLTSTVTILTILAMTKQEAVAIFGTNRKLAEALRISTQAVSQWPEVLSQGIADRVLGAKTRLRVRKKANGQGNSDSGS